MPISSAPDRPAEGSQAGPSLGDNRRLEWIAVGLLAAWLTAWLLIRFPALLFGGFDGVDSPVYATAGDLLRRGGTPYVSFWDHKPPLIYFINALGLAIAGGRLWGIWVVGLASMVGALLIGYIALRSPLGRSAALLGAAFYAFSLPAVVTPNHIEQYVLPIQWGAVLLLVRADRFRGGFLPGLLLGLLGALAFFLRQNLTGSVVAVGIVFSMMMLRERRVRSWGAFVAGGLGGVALLGALIVAYLAAQGSLDAYWDQSFHFNFLYSDVSWGARRRAGFIGLKAAVSYGSIVLPAAGWLLAIYRLREGTRDAPQRALLLLAVVWLPIELVFVSISGRPYLYYFSAICAPLALLAAITGAAFSGVARTPARRTSSSTPLPIVAFLVIAMAVLPAADTVLLLPATGLPRDRMAQTSAVVGFIRANTRPAETIYVWGFQPELYLLSRREPASRYIYAVPLLSAGYSGAPLVDGFLRELQRNSPALIVDSFAGRGIPPLSRWNDTPAPPPYFLEPELARFYDFVARNYELVAQVGPERWPVFRRIPRAAAGSADVLGTIRIAGPRTEPIRPDPV